MARASGVVRLNEHEGKRGRGQLMPLSSVDEAEYVLSLAYLAARAGNVNHTVDLPLTA